MFLSSGIIQLFAVIVGLLMAITIHEFSHALAARLLGDRTAEGMGRLSLNPLVHLDPLGTLMMLLTAITGFGIGWGKPTPVSPWNLRLGRRLGMAVVAAAGPLSNLALAVALAVILRLLPYPTDTAVLVLGRILILNVGLAAFNLLPLPILDGFHILKGIVSSIPGSAPSNVLYQLERIEPHGPMILLVLILLPRVLSFDPLMLFVGPLFRLLLSIVSLI